MIIRQLPRTCLEAFTMLRDLSFANMTEDDYAEFAGTESPCGQIARVDNMIVIVDMNEVAFMEVDPETCEMADCRFTFEGY